MQFEIGKIYDIQHQRKGKFSLRVTGQCDEWLTGDIVNGTANAMMDYNEREAGESITVRKSLMTARESVIDRFRPEIVNAYMDYMRRDNPGRGMTLEEFARNWRG